ncbi:MAG: hypothetical protein QM535_18060 [Limnohabitans sp.]|nr:hypothetical protein [Limnohabitans sp.]
MKTKKLTTFKKELAFKKIEIIELNDNNMISIKGKGGTDETVNVSVEVRTQTA